MMKQFKFKVSLLLIGDQSVGKSSILLRYGSSKFEEKSMPTIGIDLHIQNLPEQGVVMECFDSSGQNRYQSIISPFYKNCDAVILTYDVTNNQSFVNIKKWLKIIHYHCDKENVQIVLVGNKCDLKDTRVISVQQGEEIANELGFPFFETSAKENLNIEKVFDKIIDLVIEKMTKAYYYKKDSIFVKNERRTDIMGKSKFWKFSNMILCNCLNDMSGSNV